MRDFSTALTLSRAGLIAVTAALAAGCTTSGMPVLDAGSLNLSASGFALPGGSPGGNAPAQAGNPLAAPRTVSFEVIDGAPDQRFFRKLVAQLTEEANARRIAVVSRAQPAQYVIRGYLAAHVQDPKTTITWVWDVFSAADHQRVARFTGEAPGTPSERAWAAADDAVVARMAQDTMNRLAAFLGTSAPDVAAAAAQEPLAYLPR